MLCFWEESLCSVGKDLRNLADWKFTWSHSFCWMPVGLPVRNRKSHLRKKHSCKRFSNLKEYTVHLQYIKLLAWHGLSNSQYARLYNLLSPLSKRTLDILSHERQWRTGTRKTQLQQLLYLNFKSKSVIEFRQVVNTAGNICKYFESFYLKKSNFSVTFCK